MPAQTSRGPVNTYTPGASLSPDLAASYAGTNYVVRNAPTDRTYTGYSRGYQYNPGESQDSFIMNNAKKDAKSPATAVNWMNPVGFGTRAVKGKSFYKRQRAEYEANMQRYNAALQTREEENYRDRLATMEGQEDYNRRDNLQQLDAAYNDDTRQHSRDSQYEAELASALTGLQQGHRSASRGAALDEARRGVLGGSEDAQTQVKLKAKYDSGVVDATGAAADRQASLRRADLDQYHNLRNSILSGNPVDAQRYTAMAAGDSAQAERDNGLRDFSSAFSDLRQGNADNTSQLYGSLATTAGNSYRSDQDARGHGRAGLSYWN